MLGAGPLSGAAISGGASSSGPTFDVTGLAAVAFGTPALPVLPHTVQGSLVVAFGTPAVPATLQLQVSGFNAAAFGNPKILRFTAVRAKNIRIHMSGFCAANFGRPRL